MDLHVHCCRGSSGGYSFTNGATSAWIVDKIEQEKARPIFLRSARSIRAALLPALVVYGRAPKRGESITAEEPVS